MITYRVLNGVALASVVLALSAAEAGAAQQSVLEVEPNATPQTATPFQGPSLLLGTMSGTDQDAYLWTVSDVDAGRRWNLELQGIAGALTIMEIARITYNDAGEVTAADRLFKLGSRDGLRPAFASDLIFEPGEYLLGMASAGGGRAPYRPATASLSFGESAPTEDAGPDDAAVGAYRVSLTQGSHIPATPNEPQAGPGDARPLPLERELAAFLDAEEIWYRIDLSEEHSASRWDIRARAPVGRTIEATLRTADGEALISARSTPNGAATLIDIAQPAGIYYVTIKPLLQRGDPPGFLHTLLMTEVGRRTDGSEAEPNDSWKLANRADFETCCTGRMGSNRDRDFFVYAFDESRTDQLHTLKLETDAEQAMTLCLLDDDGQQIQCRNGTGGVTMADLLLQPGDYGVRVQSGGRGEGAEYRVAFLPAGAPEPGREAEPNDTRPYASATPANHRIRGAFDGKGDVDFYKFIIPGEAQLWRFQAIGDGIGDVEYHDPRGARGQLRRVSPGQRRVTLDNQFLLPGTHYVSVRGREAGDYTLLARPLGPPDPDREMEPNDDASRMQPLRFGQTRTGLLSDPGDVDMYRFYLADWDHIELTASPPTDGQLAVELAFNGGHSLRETARTGIEGAVVLSGVFPPGDYQLSLKPVETSDAEYRLNLERKDRFTCPADCEPNDSAVFASPLPAGRVVTGRSGEWGDADWYRLPRFPAPQAVTLQLQADRNSNPEFFQRIFYENDLKKLDFELDRASNTATGVLPADADTYLRIRSNRLVNYTVTLLLDDETAPPEALLELPVTLTLKLDDEEVAAYERVGQRLTGELVLSNGGDVALELALDAAVSDARWHVDFELERVSLAANGRRSVAVEVVVRPDAWADIPVRVGARALAPDGRQVSTFADVRVGRDALAVDPVHAWNIPEALRGGINVARSQFGASVTSEPAPNNPNLKRLPHFIDGMAAIATGPDWGHRAGAPLRITVDLAGDDPVPVAGFAVNPLHQNYTHRTPRHVDFELSEDGVEFNRVLSGTLDTAGTDQYFVLDEPAPARFARLVADDSWNGQVGRPLTLGEFKVIAAPGHDPLDGKGANLADPELGGQVVWSNPGISTNWDHAILTATEENPSARVPAGQPFEWVVAFHNNRAAQIESLELRTGDAGTMVDLDELTVSVSLDSPVGPWAPIATWSRSAAGETLVLEEPVWVRFLKFSVPAPEQRSVLRAPETLIIRERATDENYRSALSEWGFRSRSAYYESTQPVPLRPRLAQRGNESRATAHPLATDTPEVGQVELGKQTQWYRLALPDAHNALTFTITGDPTVRSDLVLTDAEGNTIPLRKREQESSVGRHIFDAYVEPGQETWVQVREPERNVLFLWDTSASTGPYHQMIYNSLAAYAEDLVPGRDAANLMPFGHTRPLLDDWYGEPHLMQLVLNEFPRRGSSSSAEHTLASASKALASRSGTKAIVVVTDAATPQDRSMWDAFKQVRPRIFSLKVTSGVAIPSAAEQEQDLMQNWADVNGGHYAYLAHEGDMEVAYDRAATLLRRPANYTLSLETEAREPPGPGSLRVVAGAGNDLAGTAVELILDASGSMLQRLEGRRRIEIAREVLTSAIREHIPAGTPTALRVFGHKTPNACETDLEIPLAPLNPEAAVAKLAGITARNLARTPIAASLAAVPSDLGDAAKNGALIVLVTDGEETCDGDPLAEIERLKAAGIEIRLNVVGFAIDDQELADQFSLWADAGGGRYFAANDAEGLADSVARALAVPYEVYDASGAVVVEGIVDGDAVELVAGTYRVVVGGTVRRSFTDVEVAPESGVSLSL